MEELFRAMLSDPETKAGMDARERERRARAAEMVTRHGGAEAVLAETPDEARLREAVQPFLDAGLNPLHAPSAGQMAPDLRSAVTAAVALPSTLTAALAAYDAAEARLHDRSTLDPYHIPPTGGELHRRLLAHALDTLPAATFAEVQVRLEWMQRVLDLGYSRDVEEDQACLDSLKVDLARVAAGTIPLPPRV